MFDREYKLIQNGSYFIVKVFRLSKKCLASKFVSENSSFANWKLVFFNKSCLICYINEFTNHYNNLMIYKSLQSERSILLVT